MKTEFTLSGDTASKTYPLPEHFNGAFGIQVSAIANTMEVQATIDETTFVAIPVKNVVTGAESTSISAAGLYYFEVVGYEKIKFVKVGPGDAVVAARFNKT
jgi:hypothetical protein